MSNDGRSGIFVVVSPSGGGKTTLCRQVIERQAGRTRFSISHTTRQPRQNERDGEDYYFVEEALFRQMIDRGEFAEWAEVHDHLYGTSKQEIERAQSTGVDLLLDIDRQGGEQIKKTYPEAVLVFIMPPTMGVLKERLQKRAADSPEQILLRLHNAVAEMEFAHYCDYVIVNDELQLAVRMLEAIVIARRCRRENQLDAISRFHSAEKGTS